MIVEMQRMNESVLSLAEFTAPSPTPTLYCKKLTHEQYETQMVSETERALEVSELAKCYTFRGLLCKAGTTDYMYHVCPFSTLKIMKISLLVTLFWNGP